MDSRWKKLQEKSRQAVEGAKKGYASFCEAGRKVNDGFLAWFHRHDQWIYLTVITILAVVMRILLFPCVRGDYTGFLLPWYTNHLREQRRDPRGAVWRLYPGLQLLPLPDQPDGHRPGRDLRARRVRRRSAPLRDQGPLLPTRRNLLPDGHLLRPEGLLRGAQRRGGAIPGSDRAARPSVGGRSGMRGRPKRASFLFPAEETS